jgi:hypothetical protein
MDPGLEEVIDRPPTTLVVFLIDMSSFFVPVVDLAHSCQLEGMWINIEKYGLLEVNASQPVQQCLQD